MNEIQEALVLFEQYNGINLENYVSYDYDCTDEEVFLLKDNYIGKDIIEERVQEWLEFFDDDDKYVFLELLSKYRYFTKEKYEKIMKHIYEKVLGELSEGDEKNSIMFITFPSKKGRCSGGDHLRAVLENILIGKFPKDNIIADVDKVEEADFNNIKYVVFVDDIVGSGNTLYGRVSSICKKFTLNQKNIKLYIATIYSNKNKIIQKKTDLEKKGIYISQIIEYETTGKCFASGCVFDEKTRSKYQEIVKKYETLIEEQKLDYDDEIESVLGFKNGQLLVSFYYNTPNNTLSTFWRPSKVSQPLFIRNKYTRPSTLDIRKNKEKTQKNAYLKRQIENGIKNE